MPSRQESKLPKRQKSNSEYSIAIHPKAVTPQATVSKILIYGITAARKTH